MITIRIGFGIRNELSEKKLLAVYKRLYFSHTILYSQQFY